VEQSIATAFQLRTYADVIMNIVNPENVALDSVELTFKDQYMGRSEMWRLKNSLVRGIMYLKNHIAYSFNVCCNSQSLFLNFQVNTCVYLNKKIEFCGGSIRCQVYEMWSMGDRVACGVITDDTKVKAVISHSFINPVDQDK
jgi:hypothetical protein